MKKTLIALMAAILVIISVLPAAAYPRRKGNIHRGGYGRQFYDRRRDHFDRDFFYRHREDPCDQWAYYDYDIRATRRAVRELTGLIYDLKTLKRVLDGRDRHPGRNRHWR
jgi:hypothetical protein